MNYSDKRQKAGFTTNADEKLRKENETAENKKGIENHIKAGEHFAIASRLQYDAAKLHGEGNHEQANQAVLFAIGHANLAARFQVQDIEHHITESNTIT